MGKGTHEALYGALKKKVAESPNQTRDVTIKGVLEAFEATGPAPGGNPTGEDLQNALDSYKPKLQRTCPGYNAQPMEKKTMEARYEYSRECRNAMMTIITEDVMRDRIFDQIAKGMFQKDFGKQVPDKVKPFRWVDKLIKIGASNEVRYHNEEVVALAMLATSYKYDRKPGKQAAKELFRKTRFDHYVNDLKLSENEAEKKAKKELETAMDRLLNLVLKQMEADCPPMDVADQARDAILTGTANKLPGGLEGAYRKIMNPGSYLAWNVKDMSSDFASFGRSLDVNEYNRLFRPREMNSTTTHDAIVSMVANPFYAILDADNLANNQMVGLQPKGEKENPDLSAAMAFGSDISSGLAQARNEMKVRKMLPRFALKGGDDRGVRDLDTDISIYSNKHGRTVIIVSDPISTKNGLHITASADVPGKLINRKFADKMAALRQQSVAHDRFMHSSGKYRSMKSALKALASTRIPDNISKKQARKLEKRIKDLQKATKAYLDRKNKQFRDRGTTEGKDPYEQARYNFAKQMDSYLEDLLPKAKYLREHAETMEKVLSAEQSEAKQMRKAKGQLVLKNPDLTPFQRSVREEDLKFEEEERQRELERFRKEDADRKARAEEEAKATKQQADEGDALNAELADMEKDIAPEMMNAPQQAPKEMGPVLKAATEKAEHAYQQALESGDPKEIQARGEDLLATRAVWQTILAGYMTRSAIGAQFQNIAEGGQLDKLVNGMKNNTRFRERLAKTDMSSKVAFEQNADTTASMTGKYVVKTITLSLKRVARNNNNIINTDSNNIINTNSNNIINTNSNANQKSAMKGGPQAG